MSFISLYYLIFLISVVTVNYLLPAKYRTFWLLAASWFFYLTWQPAFLIILVFITLISFFAGIKIASTAEKAQRKKKLIGSVILLFLPLLFFKYFNVFNSSLRDFFPQFVLDNSVSQQPYLIPLGISFFTFQAVSYVADIYRNYLEPERKIEKYALYLAFFPTLLAGPIERAKAVLNQLGNPAKFESENIRAGLQLILWGVFKKVVLADRMADFLGNVYDEPQKFQGVFIYLAIVFTGLQVFCDFSAYSDIAVGSAKMLGIKLTKNFDDRVYAAPSREIFWQGWHRSLTSWMRDYVFFPLSRGTKAKSRLYLNLIIVYFLVGLWHGAAWGFIIWGLLNGFWLALESATKSARQKLFANLKINTDGRIFYFLAWLFVFHIGSFFGVFFRENDPLKALSFIRNLTNSNANFIVSRETQNCLVTVALLIFMDLINRKIPKNQNFDAFINNQPLLVRWIMYILLAEMILRYLYVFENTGFVYFNF
jgi:alginate O-acetyltransferase complex protein AlgI